jgi:hypothetical protein
MTMQEGLWGDACQAGLTGALYLGRGGPAGGR